jgi:hypothetical protein
MRKSIVCIAVLSLFTVNLAAQDTPPPDDGRARVVAAIEKGDTVTAEKIMLELTPATPAGTPQDGSVFYEQIRSCGFYPQESRLACTIDIKQNFGYAGPVGSFGSFEYVSFFIDWTGNGFQTTDYVGSGIVHITDGSGGTNFAVYRDFNPPGGPRTNNGGPVTTTTTNGPLVRAQAKLSWFTPVTDPNGPLVWGNNFFFTIRMMPIR